MNPGPAISARSKIVPSRETASSSSSAIFRGAIRKVLALTIATFAAKSPWDLSAGTSTRNAGMGSAGIFPSATSRPRPSTSSWCSASDAFFIQSAIFHFVPFVSFCRSHRMVMVFSDRKFAFISTVYSISTTPEFSSSSQSSRFACTPMVIAPNGV